MYTQLPRWTPRFFVFRCIYTNCISQETKRNVTLAFKIYSCRGFPKWASNFRIILVPRGCVSFLSAPRIATSEKIQHRHSAHAQSQVWQSDWLRIRNDYSAHARKIGPSQRSRFLVLTKEAWPPGKRMLHKLSPKRMRVSSTSTVVCTRGTFVCLPVNLGDCFGVVFLNKLYGTD